MYDGIIIHYNEIAIKGKNRVYFEKKLISNISSAIGKDYLIERRYGYLFFSLKINTIEEVALLRKKLAITAGVSNFSFVKTTLLDINDIKLKSKQLLENIPFNTFKVEAKRSNKKFEIKSPEINVTLGEHIILSLGKKVDVKNPDLILFVEVYEKQAFLFIKKEKGIGGLPVGVSSKVICSLSGGIDSPVAAYLFMKRGSAVTFVHIYNNTLVKEQILEKIKELVKKLSLFQVKSKLYVVPFSDIQKQIIANTPSEYRMIIYRRYMFKIIEEIALKENAKAVVTGDNLGQVASQTIENITSIYSATKLPIFSPLIAFDKNEIISIAKEIDTYKTSIIPYPDCCSYMLSKHPKTKTDVEEILSLEKKIDSEKELIKNAISSSDIFIY